MDLSTGEWYNFVSGVAAPGGGTAGLSNNAGVHGVGPGPEPTIKPQSIMASEVMFSPIGTQDTFPWDLCAMPCSNEVFIEVSAFVDVRVEVSAVTVSETFIHVGLYREPADLSSSHPFPGLQPMPSQCEPRHLSSRMHGWPRSMAGMPVRYYIAHAATLSCKLERLPCELAPLDELSANSAIPLCVDSHFSSCGARCDSFVIGSGHSLDEVGQSVRLGGPVYAHSVLRSHLLRLSNEDIEEGLLELLKTFDLSYDQLMAADGVDMPVLNAFRDIARQWNRACGDFGGDREGKPLTTDAAWDLSWHNATRHLRKHPGQSQFCDLKLELDRASSEAAGVADGLAPLGVVAHTSGRHTVIGTLSRGDRALRCSLDVALVQLRSSADAHTGLPDMRSGWLGTTRIMVADPFSLDQMSPKLSLYCRCVGVGVTERHQLVDFEAGASWLRCFEESVTSGVGDRVSTCIGAIRVKPAWPTGASGGVVFVTVGGQEVLLGICSAANKMYGFAVALLPCLLHYGVNPASFEIVEFVPGRREPRLKPVDITAFSWEQSSPES